nr:hypothetical protein B0A51_04552 [Rachicladosporium sp. CCFEE 5018]
MSAITATMAAAGFEKRSSTSSSLQTPGSGTFPSEMRSPMAGSPGFLKRDEALRTPITPPSAYLDFLRNATPAMMSPMSTSTSSHFRFSDKPVDKSNDKASVTHLDRISIPTPTSQPALSRNTSYASTASTSTNASDSAASFSSAGSSRTRPESPRIMIPPSPFIKPGPRSSRTPRKLQIPQSPFSPAMQSSRSAQSPYSSTPLSAAPWSASFTPADVDTEVNGKPGKVSVRQVVTRTVTYCRTPLEPAPRGKRRKLESGEEDSLWPMKPPATNATDKATLDRVSEEPVVKSEATTTPSQVTAPAAVVATKTPPPVTSPAPPAAS